MLRSERRLDPAIRDELDALDAALRGDPAPDGALDGRGAPADLGATGPNRTAAGGADARELATLVADVRAARPALDADARGRLEARADELRAARGRSGTARTGRRRRLAVALAAVAAVAVPAAAVVRSGSPGEQASLATRSFMADQPVREQQSLEGPERRSGNAASGAAGASGLGRPNDPGGRQVIRDVRQTVRVAPDGVARAAARVGEIAEDADGYVADSSVRERGRSAGGRFEVVVPTARLNATVAALGRVGSPVSLERSSTDVTDQAVTLQDRLDDARADRAALRLQLARTVDPDRRAARRRELRLLSSRVARLQAERGELRGRTSTARIALRLTTREPSAGTGTPVDDGRWGLGEAWRDAGRVLEVAAGIGLLGAIVLLPAGLLLAVVVALRRRAAGARRARVIDAS